METKLYLTTQQAGFSTNEFLVEAMSLEDALSMSDSYYGHEIKLTGEPHIVEPV